MYSVFCALSRIFILVALFIVGCFNNAPAYAQQCSAVYESVTKIPAPDLGAYNVWETLYAQAEEEQKFTNAFLSEDGILAIGEQVTLKGVYPQILMAQFDHLGRELWHKTHKLSFLTKVVDVLPTKDGYMILANYKSKKGKSAVWFGFFDKESKFLSSKTINDKRFDLFARDIVAQLNGEGWIVSISAKSVYGAGDYQNSITRASLYKIDQDGNETDSRSYVLGQENDILSLSIAKISDGRPGYFAVGRFENSEGKVKAWALRLDESLSLVWQKEFGRGVSAKFNSVISYDSRYLLIGGGVGSADTGYKLGAMGAWVMMLDQTHGQPIWQRYYMTEREEYGYELRGLNVNEDGLITVMMAGQLREELLDDFEATHEGDVDYAQILTLTPRGLMLGSDAYYSGSGVDAQNLYEWKDGFRVMVGSAKVPAKTMLEQQVMKNAKSGAANPPLREYGTVQLPDVDVKDKAKKGLALLQKKIKEQDVENKDNQKEMANDAVNDDSLIRRGWIVVGDAPETYTDPCKPKYKKKTKK